MKKIALLFVLVFLFSVNLFAEDTAASGHNGPAYGATSCETTGANGENAPLAQNGASSKKPVIESDGWTYCKDFPTAPSCNLGTNPK